MKRQAFPSVHTLCPCGDERFKHKALRYECLMPYCKCPEFIDWEKSK